MIVCGSNGANEALMEMVDGVLGDRIVSVFDGTTPEKKAETAFEVIDELEETDADVLVAIGGDSNLDVARQASIFDSDGRSLSAL